jgi:hypothetical protein
MFRFHDFYRIPLRAVLGAVVAVSVAQAQGTATQTIEFLPISDRPVTSAPFQVVAVASSNLPVTLTVQGPAMLDTRRLLTLTAPGQVTLTAVQPGNTQYAAASATLSFNVKPSPSTLTWQPQAIVYGMPLSAAGLNATATAAPLVDPAADIATVTSQIGSSQIAPGAPIPYPQTSPVFRYEGWTMEAATNPQSNHGYIPTGSLGPTYRVAFSCDCLQFEYVVQSRASSYRLWVDGAYTSLDETIPVDDFPKVNFVRVQFPDKRLRQIKLTIGGAPPFFGVITAGGDTISAPQVPLGERVIVFGDSWTGPTILQAALPPAQDGLSGSGYPEFLGQYFNWDYWDSGVGGEGFTRPGTDPFGRDFPQRVLNDVCPNAPAAVVLLGGVNDGSATEANAQAGMQATLANLQACLPGIPLYMYGPQFVFPAIDQAFAAVVPQFNFVHYVNMGEQQWIYGPSNATATGNAYLYFNGHPTPLGHNFLAEKIAVDLVNSYPWLLPAPYPLMTPAPLPGDVSYSTAPSTLLPAGANAITAYFQPEDSINYAASSVESTVTVSKANSAMSLALGEDYYGPKITVTVYPQIAGTPTGTILVSKAGELPLATIPLADGTAAFYTTGLPPHTVLNFAYSGDQNFNPTAGATITPPVTPLNP